MVLDYNGSYRHDVWLMQWYARLVASGELAKMLPTRHQPFGTFMRFFTPPTLLRLEIADPETNEAPLAAAWFCPLLDGAVVGMYLAPEIRHLRAGIRFGVDAFTWGLARFPVLIGWTINPRRAQTYRRFGFALSGAVPHGRDGQTMLMLTLTAPQLARWHGRLDRHAMAGAR